MPFWFEKLWAIASLWKPSYVFTKTSMGSNRMTKILVCLLMNWRTNGLKVSGMTGGERLLPLHQKFPKFLLKIHHKLHLRQPLLRLKLLLQSRLHLLVTWALLLAEHLRASLEECLHWFLRNDLSEFHQLLLTL